MSRLLAPLAAAPHPGTISVNFTTINWWWYTLILVAVFLFLGAKKRPYLYSAGIMVVVAVIYALFMVYVRPHL